jgi:hypothetical protein
VALQNCNNTVSGHKIAICCPATSSAQFFPATPSAMVIEHVCIPVPALLHEIGAIVRIAGVKLTCGGSGANPAVQLPQLTVCAPSSTAPPNWIERTMPGIFATIGGGGAMLAIGGGAARGGGGGSAAQPASANAAANAKAATLGFIALISPPFVARFMFASQVSASPPTAFDYRFG